MIKIDILETISYKQRRAKFGNNWFPLDPFMDMGKLKFGKRYKADFALENGIWYIANLEEEN